MSLLSFARPRSRALRAAAAFAVAALLAPAAASADPTTDAALRAFVAAVDGSPDWAATSQGMSTDATGASVLTGLSITSTLPGMSFTADTLAVTKGTSTSDGRYTAAKLVAGNVTIAAGPLSVTLANVEFDDFALPNGLAFAFDPTKPFTSMVAAYSALAKAHLGQAHAASLALNEMLVNTTSRVTYNDVTLTHLDGGRITTLSAGPLTTQLPVPDKLDPQPLITASVAHADAKDIDLGAILHTFDPPVPGAPRPFVPAIANVTYRTTTLQLAPRDTPAGPSQSVTVKIGSMSLDDFRVRPPEHSIAADLDKSLLTPFADEATSADPAGMINLLSAYSIGHFTATPIDITATGIDTLHVDGITLANLSLDGLGEFDVNNFVAAVNGYVSLQAGKVAVGGLTFPTSAAIETSYKAATTGGDANLSSLVPALGFVELDGLDAKFDQMAAPTLPPEALETTLGKLRLDFANPVTNIPTSVKFDLEGANLAAALIPGLNSQLTHYGYTKLMVDGAGQIAWNEAKKTTTITGGKFSIKDVGAVGVDAVLNGPATRDQVASLGSKTARPTFGNNLSLVSATISFKDDSIVGRVLADQATSLKVDPDKFRDQFTRGLPFMLLPVGTSDFQKKATPVFQDFIRNPGTITFVAAPAMPIPLPTLLDSAHGTAIFNLPTQLNLSVSDIPGPKPVSAPAQVTPVTPAPVAPSPSPTPVPAAPTAPAPAIPAAPAAPVSGGTGGTVPPAK